MMATARPLVLDPVQYDNPWRPQEDWDQDDNDMDKDEQMEEVESRRPSEADNQGRRFRVIRDRTRNMKNSAWKSSPVWSFGPKRKDQDQDQSTHFLKPQKTGPGPEKTKTAVFFSLGPVLVQTGYNQFKTGFSTTYAINFAIVSH